MNKTAIKYVNVSSTRQRQFRPVENPVVYAKFPKYVYKKSPMEKINKLLGIILLILVVFSLIIYYFVSDTEKNMNKIGKEIVTLTNENIELQNKLDNLHSFNKVDEFIKHNSKLNTAKKIIEIPAVNNVTEPNIEPVNVNYKWSLGY